MSEPEELILLEEQAKRIKELEAVIRKHCRDCWAFRGSDPAQCRACALREFKPKQ